MTVTRLWPIKDPAIRNKWIYYKRRCPDCGGELVDDGCSDCMFHVHNAMVVG